MYLHEYAQQWLDKYPILKVRKWIPSERKINTGVNGKKFCIDVRNGYTPNTAIWSFIILHELMHAALVREDELFLPNLGMSTAIDVNIYGVEYWINELTMMMYMENIFKQYPPNPFYGNLIQGGPAAKETFFSMAANCDPAIPQEWHYISSSEKMYARFMSVYTVELFESKLTTALDFLTAVLNQIPDKPLQKKTTTVKPPWPQYVREPLRINYPEPIRTFPVRQTMKQRPR